MTNEEALDLVRKYDCNHKDVCKEAFCDECSEAYGILKLLVEAHDLLKIFLEKEKKYRWHDLRKNPDDLPKENEVVLCVTRDIEYSTRYRKEIMPYTEKYPYSSIVAWRKIEPFEVNE